MDNLILPQRSPRLLKYRQLYKWYWGFLSLILSFYIIFFSYIIFKNPHLDFWQNYRFEIISGIFYSIIFSAFSFYSWNRSQLKSVQVFKDKLVINWKNHSHEYMISEIQAIKWIFRSCFRIQLKSGESIYFSSMVERSDYIWEGLFLSRPELFHSSEWYEQKRVSLVQYDHHEMRKEWFFATKMIDLLQWIIAPVLLMFLAFEFQSHSIKIHALDTYLFRLTMFATLTLLYCSLMTSFFLKKFVFDQVVKKQMAGPKANKTRNLEREKMLLKNGKYFQLFLSVFIFGFVVYSDANLFSITRIKSDLSFWDLPKGKTVFVDNRYNCLNCNFSVSEGDKILFGKGFVGVVMAVENESMTYIKDGDTNNRTIASEDILKVPQHHVMVKTGLKKDEFVMVKITDLIGKIKIP